MIPGVCISGGQLTIFLTDHKITLQIFLIRCEVVLAEVDCIHVKVLDFKRGMPGMLQLYLSICQGNTCTYVNKIRQDIF